MKIAVVVASRGRAVELQDLLGDLARQTIAPDIIVFSVVSGKDLPPSLPPHVETIMGPAGLAAQRNRGLDAVRNRCDVIIFYDDDFVPAKDSISGIAHFFEQFRELGGATGSVLADGVRGDGISHEQARALVHDFESRPPAKIVNEDYLFAYGCNMAFRCAFIGDSRFDENLALYGWQEDMDFAAQIARRGNVVRTTAFTGVHRGVKGGRSSGKALGFSQIVNPIYLVRKGTMTPPKAAKLIFRNLVANHLKLFRPEPHVDRRGRLLGNWIGIMHVLRGKTDPRQILAMQPDAARTG